MGRQTYIGLMTGTSMDAMDAVLVDLAGAKPALLAAHALPLPDTLQGRLLSVHEHTPLVEIVDLDARLGEALARAVTELLGHAGAEPRDVRAIGSHGQTIWHAPDTEYPATLQIGDPNRIAQRTGITVVADFRRRDMAAGGQGAPLAPAFHQAFFASAAEPRTLVNIGGMANITCLPADGRPITGFDTGPGNVLLDAWCRRHGRGDYDADGEWAAGGTVDGELLARLLADPYFHRPPPKSTGREHFNAAWLENAGVSAYPARDVQATLAELTATTIADGLRDSMADAQRLLVCGGGARNEDLMRRLARTAPGVRVESTAAHGLPPEWVEAAGFAWLAHATLEGRSGNIPSVTGASEPVPLGAIHPAGTGLAQQG